MRMTAPEFEKYFNSLTIEERKHILDRLPKDLCDQLDAAQNQMIAEAESMTGTQFRHAEIPDWVRLSITDAMLQWVQGESDTCQHCPSPLRPEPLYVAAWRPGLIVCGQCLPMLHDEDFSSRICDSCGMGRCVRALVVQSGIFQFFAALCADCKEVA